VLTGHDVRTNGKVMMAELLTDIPLAVLWST
jgi:hypothetical protein